MENIKIYTTKAISWIKGHKTIFTLGVVIAAIVGFFIFKGGSPALAERTTRAAIGDVEQEVSVTGRVNSAQAVDLAFDRSGRVIYVAVHAGSKVVSGQTLAQLDSSELYAQRQRELANISAQEQRLNQLMATSNDSGATGNSSTIDTLSKSLKIGIDAMTDLTNIQYSYYKLYTIDYSDNAFPIAEAKAKALKAIYGIDDLGQKTTWDFINLNGGLKYKINQAEQNPSLTDYDALVSETKSMLLLVKNALTVINTSMTNASGTSPANIVSAAHFATIKTDTDLVIAQISSLTTQTKSLVNENYDINIAQLQVDQAKASLALIDAQIAKNTLRAPFYGTITNVDMERGQIAGASSVISMIGSAKFEVEVNVSEADIAKIKIGNQAIITLDAYGPDNKFEATVAQIDPAAKIIEGVATYRVTLQFNKQDTKILPGLTANIDIKTDHRSNVLYISSRDIIVKNGKKYVRVLVQNDNTDVRFANLQIVSEDKTQKTYDLEVQTGLKGSDGRIEILSSVKEGDLIVGK